MHRDYFDCSHLYGVTEIIVKSRSDVSLPIVPTELMYNFACMRMWVRVLLCVLTLCHTPMANFSFKKGRGKRTVMLGHPLSLLLV